MPDDQLSTDTPYLVIREPEPDGQGGQIATTTIFLTASTCPVGCAMCDLHRFTLAAPTPPGAIVRQIDSAIQGHPVDGWLKLYNSGNFFDPRSIPTTDHAQIAQRTRGFNRVVVENHPRFGRNRVLRFRDLLEAPLEIAVGLETVQPRWLSRMGKQMSRDEFDQYAAWLAEHGINLRVFLIVGVPGIDVAESIRWARLSVRHAVAQGARHISLIPARAGHQWQSVADSIPRPNPSDLLRLHQHAIEDADGHATVTVDLWDLPPSADRDRLQQANLTQQPQGL